MTIYLDNAATTKPDPAVVKVMSKVAYGNPSSPHVIGEQAAKELAEARKDIAATFGCKPGEVVFTSGATESNYLAIFGIARHAEKKHIITSSIEHNSVLDVCRQLEKEGCKVTYLPVSEEGVVDVKVVEDAFTADTCLVTIMAANNEVGTVQPIKEIGAICRKKGVVFHTDFVQGFLKMPIPAEIDLASLSAHKLHGPKGVGALIVKEGVELQPIVTSSGQENGLRPGTENMSGIVGFATAVKLWNEKENLAMEELRDYCIKGLQERFPDCKINGSLQHRICNNVHVSFPLFESETLIKHLSEEGICVSSGAACKSHVLEPSHVLVAMGLPKRLSLGALRVTLSKFTTKDDIDKFLTTLQKVLHDLEVLG